MKYDIKDVVLCEYNHVENFSNGLVLVSDDRGQLGFIDKSGRLVIPFGKYVYVGRSFSEGLAAVKNEKDKWGYMDKDGNEVIPYIYDKVCDFSDGLAVVGIAHGHLYCEWGAINKKGEEVVPIGKYAHVGCRGIYKKGHGGGYVPDGGFGMIHDTQERCFQEDRGGE